MQIPVLLDRSRREPLTSQLVEQLRDAIRHARIRGGTRLPSSRRLAEQLSVSRNTVIRAYDTLIIEGYVESRPASGIFVADELPGAPVTTEMHAPEPAACWHALAHADAAIAVARAEFRRSARATACRSISFLAGQARRCSRSRPGGACCRANLSHGGDIGLSQYGDPAGLPALRSAIADHLATTRGIAADPSRIVIVTGAQEGISIAARLFLNHGTPSAIEDPCYQGAAFAFEATGSEMASVAGRFRRPDPGRAAAAADGAALSDAVASISDRATRCRFERRHAIVAWARRYGCYILEDDRDGDLRYEGSPMQAIAATAPDCTIYLGTFSRTLGAGLRLGYMVVPEQLAGVVAAAKGTAQQRQSLARTGGARRNDARRFLRGASAAHAAPTTRKAAITC